MAGSKLALTWSQTENCIDDGGFLPRLAWSLKIDYREMVKGIDSDSYIQFKTRREACKSLNNLVLVHFRTFPFQSRLTGLHILYFVYYRASVCQCSSVSFLQFWLDPTLFAKNGRNHEFYYFYRKKLCWTFHFSIEKDDTYLLCMYNCICILCSVFCWLLHWRRIWWQHYKNKRFLSSKELKHYLTEKVIKEFPPLFDSSTWFLSINL